MSDVDHVLDVVHAFCEIGAPTDSRWVTSLDHVRYVRAALVADDEAAAWRHLRAAVTMRVRERVVDTSPAWFDRRGAAYGAALGELVRGRP